MIEDSGSRWSPVAGSRRESTTKQHSLEAEISKTPTRNRQRVGKASLTNITALLALPLPPISGRRPETIMDILNGQKLMVLGLM